MNETFDIKRFGKLLQYEVVNYIPNFFKSLLIFASVIAAVWIFSLTVDFPVLPNGRELLVTPLFALAIVLSPFIVYKDMNNRKKGYIYAMMPASTLEKLLSMMVLCIVLVPVITYVVLTGTDLMLWALSSAGIGSFYEMEMYNPFEGVFPQEMYYDTVQQQLYSMPIFDTIISFMNAIAYSMMFNTIFRKNKVLKTILFNISMSFAFVILMSVIINTVSVEFWEEMADKLADWLKDMEIEDFMEYIRAAGRYLTILFIAIFLSITYFRIKKVNY